MGSRRQRPTGTKTETKRENGKGTEKQVRVTTDVGSEAEPGRFRKEYEIG